MSYWLSMIKHILLFFTWVFVFELNAQNAVLIHVEDVLCQLKSYKRLNQVYDSVMQQIHLYDDSIKKHFPTYCTIGWSSLRWEKWDVDYKRLIAKEEELMNNYSLIIDSSNNEIKRELKSISEQYCKLYQIDLFFTNDEPPLFGIIPKDVSEEFEAFILSLE
ncbi:MAG: hypothetical protein ACO1N0_14050 [Fluviicola sp.]